MGQQANTMPGDPWPLFQQPMYHVTYSHTPCDHCWCKGAAYPENHAQCCKCSTVMHRKFLPLIPDDARIAAEREACAVTAEAHATGAAALADRAFEIAAAIRARGEPSA